MEPIELDHSRARPIGRVRSILQLVFMFVASSGTRLGYRSSRWGPAGDRPAAGEMRRHAGADRDWMPDRGSARRALRRRATLFRLAA
jgi:hypothetical protein